MNLASTACSQTLRNALATEVLQGPEFVPIDYGFERSPQDRLAAPPADTLLRDMMSQTSDELWCRCRRGRIWRCWGCQRRTWPDYAAMSWLSRVGCLGGFTPVRAVTARAGLSGWAWAEWLVRDAGGMVPLDGVSGCGWSGAEQHAGRPDCGVAQVRVDAGGDRRGVGLSGEAAVSDALSRIACELERPVLVGPRLHRQPSPSEDW
jgi:hypothetical protein